MRDFFADQRIYLIFAEFFGDKVLYRGKEYDGVFLEFDCGRNDICERIVRLYLGSNVLDIAEDFSFGHSLKVGEGLILSIGKGLSIGC